jgi:small conductance mechanosensitive channel
MSVDITPALRKIDAMMDGFFAAIPNALLALVVLALAYFVAKRTGSLVRRILASRWPRGTAGLVLGRLLRWVIMLLGLLVAFSITFPSLTTRDLIQFLGIGTVAVGFAFRDVLQNFLAGIILLLTHPFRIGDEIAIGDVQGIVEEVETRATMVKTYDGTRVVIPNASILTRNVIVNTAFQLRRASLELDLAQGVDVGQAKGLILEAISDVDGVANSPQPRVRVKDFSNGNWKIRVTWWTAAPRSEWLGSTDKVIPAIKDKLNSAGIELPSDPLDSIAEIAEKIGSVGARSSITSMASSL